MLALKKNKNSHNMKLRLLNLQRRLHLKELQQFVHLVPQETPVIG